MKSLPLVSNIIQSSVHENDNLVILDGGRVRSEVKLALTLYDKANSTVLEKESCIVEGIILKW